MPKSIMSIAITGGSGQIAYQLLFRIASGEVFGCNQPIALKILELPTALNVLEGVKMEIEDCAFPLLHSISVTSDPLIAFENIDIAILIGAKPRGPGMERGDLLAENGKIFVEQGKALNEVAKAEAKIFVIGNPCNTNCLIAMSHAPRLSRKNFFAMTRLDQNRATFFLAQKASLPIDAVSQVAIWGNHSATQVPDFTHVRLQGRPAEQVIQDEQWLKNDFMQLVQKRGAAIIQARGKSSAASAAQAIIDAIQDTSTPKKNQQWFSSALLSEHNPYQIDDQLIFSFPCYLSEKKEVKMVEGLELSEFLIAKLKITEQELIDERNIIRSLIK